MTRTPSDDLRHQVLLYGTGVSHPGVRVQATRDQTVIRQWATEHRAEPATGQASASGPPTVDVADGGVGIRFNFPGFGRFRPISWDEWFEHFDQHELMFLYEEPDVAQIAERAHALWDARGRHAGSDRQDWFQAERGLRRVAGGDAPSLRYRIVKRE